MLKRVFRAWLIGLLIALIAVGLTVLVHTPFAAVGFILSIPIFPLMVPFTAITQRMALSDAEMTVALPVSLVVGGSVIYGAMVLVFVRLRDRHKARSG